MISLCRSCLGRCAGACAAVLASTPDCRAHRRRAMREVYAACLRAAGDPPTLVSVEARLPGGRPATWRGTGATGTCSLGPVVPGGCVADGTPLGAL